MAIFGANTSMQGATQAAFAPSFGFGSSATATAPQTQMAFGQTTPVPQTPTLFGATATAGASTAQFSFSTTATAASTPSLFGASGLSISTPATSFPSFQTGAAMGGALAPFSSGTTSLFGGSTFGATPSTPLTPQTQTPGTMQDTGGVASSQVVSDLQALQASFEPKANNASYRFRHLFTNVVNSNQSVNLAAKPANVDAIQWQEAIDEVETLDAITAEFRPSNEKLWPVSLGYGDASGFAELLQRSNAQESEIVKHKEFLDRVGSTIASITRKHDIDIKKAVNNCRAKYEEQRHKLVHIMRFVDFLEHRAFRHPFTSAEDELSKKLNALRTAIHGGSATISSSSSTSGIASDLALLPKRIETLAALARERKGNSISSKASTPIGGKIKGLNPSENKPTGLDSANIEHLCNTLSQYVEALNRVQSTLTRDMTHLEIIQKHSK